MFTCAKAAHCARIAQAGCLVPFQLDALNLSGVPYGNGRDRAERQSRHEFMERHNSQRIKWRCIVFASD